MLNLGNILNGSLFINIYFCHWKRENVLSVNVLGINTVFDGKNLTENVTCPVTRSPDLLKCSLVYFDYREKYFYFWAVLSLKFKPQVCKQIFPF